MFGYMMRYASDTARQGNWDDRYFAYGHPMMWGWGSGQAGLWISGILWLVTWVLIVLVLVALLRWLWKKGDKS